MCGIIGYIGTKGMSVEQLLQNAQFNSYRGDDGIGIIYNDTDNRTKVRKYLYEIDEIVEKQLEKWRTIKQIREGTFSYAEFDDEEYTKENKKFKTEMKSLLKIRSNFMFLHHRKATYGGDTTNNLHPIKCYGKYYLHNGTAWGMESVRKYLDVMMGIEFKSETDTEVIATLYNELRKKFNNNSDGILSVFEEMFPSGWGVLIEITPGVMDAKIIKDNSRDLWVYSKKGDGAIIISEPTPFITHFDKLYKLSNGIYNISDNIEGKDFTTMARKCVKWWQDVDKDKIHTKKCEICDREKYTLSTFACEGHDRKSENENRCFECMVMDTSKKSTLSERQKMKIKKEIYNNYLG